MLICDGCFLARRAHHHFIGYIEYLLYSCELDYLPAVGKNISARFKSRNLIAQLQACLSGAGLAALPVFAAYDLSSTQACAFSERKDSPQLLRAKRGQPKRPVDKGRLGFHRRRAA